MTFRSLPTIHPQQTPGNQTNSCHSSSQHAKEKSLSSPWDEELHPMHHTTGLTVSPHDGSSSPSPD
ncbi:hypothetical protein HJC23_006333 [Cyclotella cryptica]|uniref:Uncharacterized protein n=1 Tax=Cyclotella cryptica TaxID=29204 RepID=A0ABD3Q3T8_9STRA